MQHRQRCCCGECPSKRHVTVQQAMDGFYLGLLCQLQVATRWLASLSTRAINHQSQQMGGIVNG